MPFRCCVPSCSGNYGYGNAPKVAVFSFPEDENLKTAWLKAIPRANFTPSKYSKVCELHFSKEDIIRDVTKVDKKSGECSTSHLKRPHLNVNAVPSMFPNCPKYLSKFGPPVRKSREDKMCEKEEIDLLRAINESKAAFIAHQESTSFQNLEKLQEHLTVFPLNKNWFKVSEDSKVTFFNVQNSPGPTTNYAVVINADLKMETYLYGQEFSIKSNQITTPCQISNLESIENCLNYLDTVSMRNSPDDCDDHFKKIIQHVTNVLDKLNCGDMEKRAALDFLSEQLTLHITPKERYRYSTSTLTFSSILHTISSHAYKYLRHYSSLILPHPSTIKSICNKFLTDPTDEDRKLFLVYARNIFKQLEEHERNVILLMDEIHIQPYLDFKGGNIVGHAFNDSTLATSAYTFMISSVTSKLKEVVHIFPTSTMKSDTLFECIRTVVTKLEEIGYRVFCILSDNNALNGKAMNNFSPTKKLSIVYPHPCDNNRPLFYLYDSVHLLKCIKNNWMNPKNDKILSFPDFETGEKKTANFNSLISLHQLEHDKLLKFGYSLSLKALFPSSFERQNVSLALKIFNSFVKEALLKFGTNIANSVETADFINIVSTWWKIVNVKTPLKGQRLKDHLQTPITSKNPDDPKLIFLSKMIRWLDTWKSGDFAQKLTSQTHTALCHTIHGMLEIVQYCIEELKMNYVLLGKFQTDPLEHRFGKYRQLSGGQYHISIRQLYESEKRLRIQSLLTLSSRTFGNIPITNFSENVDDYEEDSSQLDNSLNPEIHLEEGDFAKVQHEMPVITYLAGYCCYNIVKKFKCDFCKSSLVYNEEMVVDENYDLIKNLNRGGLSFPKDIAVRVVLVSYTLFNKLLENYEDAFLSIHNKRDFVINFVFNYWQLHESEIYNFNICENHKNETILKLIINCTTNTLLKNYCGKCNDRLGKTKKRKLDTVSNK